mgnify:FL=1
MTQEKEGEASTQADKSFCLDEPKPIPDLSIAVVYTSGGLSQLPKYQALGVPEVWFWKMDRCSSTICEVADTRPSPKVKYGV